MRNRSISQKKEERKRKRDGELREKEGEIDAALSLSRMKMEGQTKFIYESREKTSLSLVLTILFGLGSDFAGVQAAPDPFTAPL